MTSYEQLYVPFFNRIEEDAKFFGYYNITTEEALEIAQKRAKNYLNEAVSILKRIALWILTLYWMMRWK